MSSLQNIIFGPLNNDACVYFYFFTGLFFFLLIIVLFSIIIFIIKKPSQVNFNFMLHSIMLFFNIFMAYFVNRLLYTMCNKTLA